MTTTPRKTKKKPTLEQDVAQIKKRQHKNELLADERQQENVEAFAEGSAKMKTLATKDDLSAVAVDMATKTDINNLHAMLFAADGTPLFATKNDVLPVVQFYNNLMLAAKFTENGGKWGSRFIIGIVATGIAFGVIFGWFKSLILLAVHTATK